MHFKKQSKIYNNLLLTFGQKIEQHLRKMVQKASSIMKGKTRNEPYVNYLNDEKSIVIEEIHLDAEWRNIFGNNKSTPTFLLSANSI